ncbi:MAG: TOMM precursor leader peptide-binding protein [Vicinamibacterales bacterium]
MTRPSFNPRFTVYLDNDTLILLSERQSHLLRGSIYERLAPLLTGRHTVDEIAERLRPDVSPVAIFSALTAMHEAGYVVDAAAADDRLEPGEADWRSLAADERATPRRSQRPSVALEVVGDVSPEPFECALRRANVTIAGDAPLVVVLTDDYLRPELDVRNRAALADGSPWFLSKPVGTELWFGPIFRPGETGCWACLADRLRRNRDIEAFFADRPHARLQQGRAAGPDADHTLAAAILARGVARWIGVERYVDLEGRIITTADGLHTGTHVLTRRPQCPACGTRPRDRAPSDTRQTDTPQTGTRQAGTPPPNTQPRVAIAGAQKVFVADGGHRTCTPEETVRRYGHLISPITGIVSHVTRLGDREDGFSIYVGGRDRRRPSRTIGELVANLRSSSGGKGRTDAQARASALCEAIERTSGSFDGSEPVVRGRAGEIANPVPPNAMMLFSDAQFAARESWNARGNLRLTVPEPFDDDEAIDWAPAWSLTRQRIAHVPAGCCYFGHPDHRVCRVTSNGHAAGNTIEEAVLQGFMELVERDSVAIWWYNRLRRPAVDLDSFDDPFFHSVLQKQAALGRRCWVLDLTFDFGIPAFVSVSAWPDREFDEVMVGFGAHFDARLAIGRAITEAAQMRAPGLSSPADNAHLDDYRRSWFRMRLADHSQLLPAGRARTANDYARDWSDDLGEDVRRCVDRAATLGLETIVLDQTREDLGMPVVKVIVPGLRPIFPRYAEGRLYEVPVRAGLLHAPTEERALNPMPLLM